MIFWSLIALVVLAPLPFASVYPWSWGLMATIVGVLLAVWSVRVFLGKELPGTGLRAMWAFALLFAVVVGWAFLQSLSVTPEAWHHPLWREAAGVLGTELSGSVSLNPAASVSAVVRLLTYGGIFWLSLQYCREPARAKQVMMALVVSGLAYATYGLIIQLSGARMILWYDKFAYLDDLTSTFVNRNSYATYAGLILVCIIGLIFGSALKSMVASENRWERVYQFLHNVTAWDGLLLVALFTVATALFLTHSRGGFLSTGVGLIVLSLAFGLARGTRARHAFILGVGSLLAGIMFFVISGDILDTRLAATSLEKEERPRVYELTVQAIEAAPMLGTGYGSFEEVFRFYRSDNIGNFYLKAHNTYLENILELGYPAALALFATFGGFLVLTFRGLRRRRRHKVYPCIGFAATALVAAHSLVDFSLQIPAVAMTYSLLMGAACAQSWSSQRPRDPW